MPSLELSRRQFLRSFLPASLLPQYEQSHPEQKPRIDDPAASEIDVPTLAVVVGALVNIAEAHHERISILEDRVPGVFPFPNESNL